MQAPLRLAAIIVLLGCVMIAGNALPQDCDSVEPDWLNPDDAPAGKRSPCQPTF
ncbi:uncharacterized protein PHACADRAFT_265168 [Phanerochaete carnosa HHB-10118-sp]|uniref:Uncharacterized protein n=1 Tax=Phanerochaete carnosa (strain HHB-10118-sp) TaxID=650164 RepID=K5VSR1_PHACS|nr:uncharacterized protein PHACADRAFT_265168 [Phanerochaete carnosa HHB-10118-sp]EKM49614.1 hypothetical protein PHACADRAFT_265168 [Phanerochaete carnosa HHB-10118-sp]